jgi:hypothetical protein
MISDFRPSPRKHPQLWSRHPAIRTTSIPLHAAAEASMSVPGPLPSHSPGNNPQPPGRIAPIGKALRPVPQSLPSLPCVRKIAKPIDARTIPSLNHQRTEYLPRTHPETVSCCGRILNLPRVEILWTKAALGFLFRVLTCKHFAYSLVTFRIRPFIKKGGRICARLNNTSVLRS